jgi:circadian clock protein KaiC
MTKKTELPRLETGVRNLDAVFGGGLPKGSVLVLAGPPGSGKTILTQQLCFHTRGAKRREPGHYVTLEEGPEKAVEKKLVDVVYFARQHSRAGQFLAVLTDKIRALKARRLVLDSVTHMSTEDSAENRHQVLSALAVRFRALGVTTVLTLESTAMHAAESVTGRHFSPVADNVIMLRYARSRGRLAPILSVVKTRGSAHDRARYHYEIGEGGMRIGERVAAGARSASEPGGLRRGNGDPRRKRR